MGLGASSISSEESLKVRHDCLSKHVKPNPRIVCDMLCLEYLQKARLGFQMHRTPYLQSRDQPAPTPLRIFMQTAIVKIHRAPPNGDRPLQFFPDGDHNAAWAVEQAGVLWGSGELKDSKGVVIISNPMWHLKAGEYSYEIGGESHTSPLLGCQSLT